MLWENESLKILKILFCSPPHTVLLTLLILTVFRTHVAYEPSRNWRSSKQVSAVAQWIERPFSGLNLVRDLFCFVPRSWLDELLIHHFTATKHLIYHDLVNLISASLIKSKSNESIFPLYFSSMLFSFFLRLTEKIRSVGLEV